MLEGKFEGGMSPQERGESKEQEPKVLAFEGVELFRQTQEQIDRLRQQMEEARTAMKVDMDTIAPESLLKMSLENGVRDKSYITALYNLGIHDYSGEAEIEVNGRKYKAVGRSPRGTAVYISRTGFIEYVPQETPEVKGEELSGEQESFYRMSSQQLDSLKRRINLAEKVLTQGFDQFAPDELIKLALEHGIEDRSYNTVSGIASYYSGKTEIVIKGERYEVIGHRPRGTAEYMSENGYIEWRFIEGAGK